MKVVSLLQGTYYYGFLYYFHLFMWYDSIFICKSYMALIERRGFFYSDNGKGWVLNILVPVFLKWVKKMSVHDSWCQKRSCQEGIH